MFEFLCPLFQGVLVLCLINQSHPFGVSEYFHNLLWNVASKGKRHLSFFPNFGSSTTSSLEPTKPSLTGRGGRKLRRGDLARPRHRKRKALIVSKKVLKRAKKVLDFDSLCEALPSTASKRPHSLARPLLHWCGEAPKAVEIEAVSRGSFKSSWSLMRLKRRPRAWGREGPASARLLKRP